MDHVPVFLLLLLPFVTLCDALEIPENHGFVADGTGSYFKNGADIGNIKYTIWLNIDNNGDATFQIVDYNGARAVDGFNELGLHVHGWQVPNEVGNPFSVTIRRPYYKKPTQAVGGVSNLQALNNPHQYAWSTGSSMNIADSTSESSSNFYRVSYSKKTMNSKCTETIVIQGQPTAITKAIDDEFNPQCERAEREQHPVGSFLFVGGIDQNLCVYGEKELSKQLIVVRDGKCEIRDYSNGKSRIKYYYFTTHNCEKAKDKIINLDYLVRNPRGALEETKRLQQQLQELVQKVTGITGVDKPTSSGSTKPADTQADSSSSSSSSSNHPKNKHRVGLVRTLFRGLWHFIKNVGRILAFRRPKTYD